MLLATLHLPLQKYALRQCKYCVTSHVTLRDGGSWSDGVSGWICSGFY
jgi:hypothetical protein